MPIEFRPLTPVIGAEVVGIDLNQVEKRKFDLIHAAWLKYAILLFRGQNGLSPEGHLAFSEMFGEIDLPDTPDYTLPGHSLISVVSNVVENGRHIGAPNAGRHWHSDSQFLEIPPSASLLIAREVPPSEGDTGFANMYGAYEALDPTLRNEIDGMQIRHSRIKAYSVFHPERPPLTEEEKARVPDVVHPMVRIHPETRRKALYIGGAQHGGSIVGMAAAESDSLLERLRAHCTQPKFVYMHRWKVGDMIVWDNRCTMHCAMPFDEVSYRRIMHRTQVIGAPV